MQIWSRLRGKPAPPTAAPKLHRPGDLLRAVREEERLKPLDYATLAAAVVGSIREQIGSGWMMACNLEEFIADYMIVAGLDERTVNRVELRAAIRARPGVTYQQKQRIKTDARFRELRAWVRAQYRTDQERLARILGDKIAVYYVAAPETVQGRDVPDQRPGAVRSIRDLAGPHPGRAAGREPGRALSQQQRAA